MKYLVPVLALLATTANTQDFNTVKQCIYERCPDQAAKCNASCEATLEKCANKCGLKVDQVCWGGCVGLFGPTTNVALCAANKGCLAASTEQFNFEQLGKLIDQYLRKE